MTVHITINTDNEAFDDGMEGSTEVSRILRELSTRIYHDEGLEKMMIRDINGNTVGKLEVRED